MEPNVKAPAPMAADAPKKYRWKDGKASNMYPGFKLEVTNDHLSGKEGHLFVSAFKKLDKKNGTLPDGKPKPGYKGFDDFLEEVK